LAKTRVLNRSAETKTQAVPAADRRASTRVTSAMEAKRLDPVIHERMRLAIISALAVSDKLSFNELRGLLETSDGNISIHTRRLEEAGYIQVLKSFSGRMPKTEYAITPEGKKALVGYLETMQQIIRSQNKN